MTRVVVIGAGVAGCAAAVAAAHAGAEVFLVEASHHVGGVAAQGEHRTMCGLAPIDAAHPELLEPAVQPWLDEIATGEPWRQGRVWLWPTSAEALQRGCRQRLSAAGVHVCTGMQVDACDIIDDAVLTVASGKQRWNCDAWIDASGGSAVAQVLQATIRPAQAWGAWRAEIAIALEPGLAARRRVLAQIATALAVPVATALVPLAPGRWQFSLDVPLATSAAQAAQWVDLAMAAVGGRVLQGACHVARRDTGGWAGHVSAKELFATQERGWSWAAWPVEAHGADGVTWRWPEVARHGIPRLATTPTVGWKNGAVIGRGMPVAADAIAALRVIGTQLGLGTAVGAAFGASAGDARRDLGVAPSGL